MIADEVQTGIGRARANGLPCSTANVPAGYRHPRKRDCQWIS